MNARIDRQLIKHVYISLQASLSFKHKFRDPRFFNDEYKIRSKLKSTSKLKTRLKKYLMPTYKLKAIVLRTFKERKTCKFFRGRETVRSLIQVNKDLNAPEEKGKNLIKEKLK